MTDKETASRKVVIDARVVVGNHGHGILRYTEELLLHLKEQKTKLKFVLLVNIDSPFNDLEWPGHIELFIMKSRWLSLRGQFELAKVLRKLNPDLFHTPSFMVPLLSDCPLITTIHDMNHVVLADNYSVFHRIYYGLILSWKVRKAKAVITVSHFSRSEILHYFKLEPNRVHVIYNGISENFGECAQLTPKAKAAFRSQFELPNEYILSIGNKKPHKNVLGTVLAYCMGDFQMPLVLLSDFDPAILEIAEKHGKKHSIFFLRFVPSEKFEQVYANASAFVYPSLYEGFGLPPVEALACGVPTVVSKLSSLPEVLQDGVIYVDPLKPADILRGMKLAVERPAEVEELIRRGKKVAQQYRWSKVAKETLSLYENTEVNHEG